MPAGPASPLLNTLGLAPEPGSPNPFVGRNGIVVILGLHHAPLVFVVLVAGLKRVPLSLVEAARIDRASARRIVAGILLPLLRPHLVAAWLLAFVAGLERRTGNWSRAIDGWESGVIHSVEEVDHGTLLLDGPSRARDCLCRSRPFPTRCGPAAWRERELCDQARQARWISKADRRLRCGGATARQRQAGAL